ncbi:MAG: carboxylesterase family protein [Woeseiaceae bacterium]
MLRAATVLSVLVTVGQLAACGGSSGNPPPPPPPPPPPVLEAGQVQTAQGIVEGTTEGELLVFRGIRYAAAPIGDLRFKAPAAPPTFAGVQIAASFGENCIQPQGMTTVGAEDCLFLNIWAHNDDTVRPVMVYLHPGAANGVGGDMTTIEPSLFADSEDVVVVNFNRRIAVLGYLALDELINENPRVTASNYAVLDVIAALQWVQDNIAEFGGDPDRIMLFGTSSGGLTTCAVLGAPEAAGLFHAVGIQSAPCTPGMMQKLNASVSFNSRFPPAVDTHRELLPAVGCDAAADVPACLRALPAEDLVLASLSVEFASPWIVFGPLIDGVVVQQDIRTALANQTAGDIPLIVGGAENEVGDQFDSLSLPDDASYRTHLANVFTDPFDDALYALYPTAAYATPKDAFLTLWSDLFYSCAVERLALEASSGAPSYLFEITRGFDTGPFAGQGAVHAIDINYLFSNFDTVGITPDAQSSVIGNAMTAAWAGLATDPTAAPPIAQDSSVFWPTYESVTSSYADFGDPVAATTGHRESRCAELFALFP